jgi:hypothetical protein
MTGKFDGKNLLFNSLECREKEWIERREGL